MPKKVLWFIAGAASEDQRKQAKDSGFVIRDSQQVRPDDFIEQCDAVFGDVPASYAAKYPNVEEKAEVIIAASAEIADAPKRGRKPKALEENQE